MLHKEFLHDLWKMVPGELDVTLKMTFTLFVLVVFIKQEFLFLNSMA